LKKHMVMIASLFFMLFLILSGCDRPITEVSVSPPSSANGAGIMEENDDERQPAESVDTRAAEQDNADIRSLLEKGKGILNLSYTAVFSSAENQFIYEYYKRDNLTKMITTEGDSQSIAVCDGKTTVYYNLPEKTGFTMLEAGDDMGLVPSTEALLNEAVYTFRTMGEESLSGYLCQVVETEDEFGVLKLWISKTLGLPIKYIGSDDNGWYSLELTDIQLGEPSNSIFVIPSDISLK